MKKIGEFIKPFIAIIIGALLFLVYLNYLSFRGATLAIGIIGVAVSVYYLAIGILGVVLGDKFSKPVKRIFDLVSVILFPTFMFVVFLIVFIIAVQGSALLPTGWVIAIASIVGALLMVVAYLLAFFIKNKVLARLSFLFSAIFVLALLLDILFVNGAPIVLGNISILNTVIYLVYTFMLFNSFPKVEEKKETKEEPEAESEE